MPSDLDLYYELSYYTLAHSSPSFIHQHIVDAFTAQQADAGTKPIAIVFALIGLYLHVERNFTGRQVQKAHMQMAKKRKLWPGLPLPKERGNITVGDVLAAAQGQSRDELIHQWCVSVWNSWAQSREQIVALARSELDIG
ncbi:MAG TPA: DUF5946 family protein [Candidatus Angelobacter sp.]|jgi:hypothetical protein